MQSCSRVRLAHREVLAVLREGIKASPSAWRYVEFAQSLKFGAELAKRMGERVEAQAAIREGISYLEVLEKQKSLPNEAVELLSEVRAEIEKANSES
jgi:hypothetical protein